MNEENSQEKILKLIAREMVTKYNGWDELPTDEEVKNELQIAFDENGIESDEQFLREFADYIFSNLQTPTRVGIQPSTSSVVEIESLLHDDPRDVTKVIVTGVLKNSPTNGGYRPPSIAQGRETYAFLSKLDEDEKKGRGDQTKVYRKKVAVKPITLPPAVPEESVAVEKDDESWFNSGVEEESSPEKPEEKKDNSSLPVIMLGTGILFILILALIALYQNWNMPTVQISNHNKDSNNVDLGSVEKIEMVPTVVPLAPPVIIPTSNTNQIVRKKICEHPPSCSCKQPGGRHSKKKRLEEHLSEEHLSEEL